MKTARLLLLMVACAGLTFGQNSSARGEKSGMRAAKSNQLAPRLPKASRRSQLPNHLRPAPPAPGSARASASASSGPGMMAPARATASSTAQPPRLQPARPSDVRHRGSNPAILVGPVHSLSSRTGSASGTGAISGTSVHRRP